MAEAQNNQQSRCDTGAGGELKSAHWGENRDRRSTALQLAETLTHARTGGRVLRERAGAGMLLATQQCLQPVRDRVLERADRGVLSADGGS